MIVVEPYDPADRDAAISLVLDIQRGELGVPITLADQPDLADVPRFYRKGRGGFWVAKHEGVVVGTLGLFDDGGEVALRKMFVHRDYRGRELGTAQHLLDALIAHAKAERIELIFLGTRPEMHAAHRFYERNHFVRIAAEALPASFPRVTFDSVFYRLSLSERPAGEAP